MLECISNDDIRKLKYMRRNLYDDAQNKKQTVYIAQTRREDAENSRPQIWLNYVTVTRKTCSDMNKTNN